MNRSLHIRATKGKKRIYGGEKRTGNRGKTENGCKISGQTDLKDVKALRKRQYKNFELQVTL